MARARAVTPPSAGWPSSARRSRSKRSTCSSASASPPGRSPRARSRNPPLLRPDARRPARPVLLSTGHEPVGGDRRRRRAHHGAARRAAPCCSARPPIRVAPETSGSTCCREFRERYRCPVGLSDHSGTIYPGRWPRSTLGADGHRGARHLEPGDVRARRRRLGHDRRAAAAGRGRPLIERDAGASGRQGSRWPRDLRADAGSVHARASCRASTSPPARCSRRHLASRSRAPAFPPARLARRSSDAACRRRRWLADERRSRTRTISEVLSMTKRKICVVVTARPSYSRIKTALQAIASHPALELQLVVAAPRRCSIATAASSSTIAEDGFTIAARVYRVLEGENLAAMAKTTGLGLLELATVFDNLQPDIVVTVADRYETLATAVAAAYMNIPVVARAGRRGHRLDRRESPARRHQAGRRPSCVVAPSRPSSASSAWARTRPRCSSPAARRSTWRRRSCRARPRLRPVMERYGGVGADLDLSKGYVVVMQHPVTTEYEQARQHVERDAARRRATWACRRCGSGRTSTPASDGTSTGIRAFRETRTPRERALLQEHGPDATSCALLYNSRCLSATRASASASARSSACRS